jgi:hypothetical protein
MIEKVEMITTEELQFLQLRLLNSGSSGLIKLDPCSRIVDFPLFLQSHVSIVMFQRKNQRYRPYLERLELVLNIINSKNYEITEDHRNNK